MKDGGSVRVGLVERSVHVIHEAVTARPQVG
jgi:hypothetical protein